MSAKPSLRHLLAAAILGLVAWVLHDFIDALMSAGITAVASWPLYTGFQRHRPRWLGRRAAAVVFTCTITVFVLAPLAFAGVALLGETHALLLDLAAAARQGAATPHWLADLPLVGPWLITRWHALIYDPGALLALTQQSDPVVLFGWAQALGRFTLRQALIVGFAVLLLHFFYEQGDSLARQWTLALRQAIGDAADRYVEVATRAVRASVFSMLAVWLFDTVAATAAYTVAAAPRALVWAAITGALAAVPFLGYAAVAALVVQLAAKGASMPGLLSLVLGCAVLLVGDKVVRPMVACGGIRLPFVWVLMACIGGFGAFGPAGLVVGPLVLAVAREMWGQRTRPGPTLPAASAGAADPARSALCRGRSDCLRRRDMGLHCTPFIG